MSIIEYNIRLIALCSIVIVGTPVTNYFSIYKHFNDFFSKKKHYLFLILITVLVISISFFYVVNCISLKPERFDCVKIERIDNYGSFAGWFDTYNITVVCGDAELELSTPFFSSNRLRKKMERMKEGEFVSLMIVSRVGYFYDIESIEN